MSTATHARTLTINLGVWTGRVISGVVALFMTMDAVMHLAKPQPVATAFNQLGVSLGLSIPIAVLALACTALYVIPRTAILGAVLLTGYLGGAVAIQARAGSAPFPTIFPVIVGVLLWAGLLLRNERVRAILAVH